MGSAPDNQLLTVPLDTFSRSASSFLLILTVFSHDLMSSRVVVAADSTHFVKSSCGVMRLLYQSNEQNSRVFRKNLYLYADFF